jgi:hypothetical protein
MSQDGVLASKGPGGDYGVIHCTNSIVLYMHEFIDKYLPPPPPLKFSSYPPISFNIRRYPLDKTLLPTEASSATLALGLGCHRDSCAQLQLQDELRRNQDQDD